MEKDKQKFNSYRIKPESGWSRPFSLFVVDVVLVVIFDAVVVVADVRIDAVVVVAVVGVAETSVRWSSR